MDRRYFTVDEARAVLPRVRDLLGKAMPALNRMHDCLPDVRRLAETGVLDAGGPAGAEYLDSLPASRGRPPGGHRFPGAAASTDCTLLGV